MGKTWPEGQGVETGLEASPAAVAPIPVASTAAAAAATTAAAEGPEFELPVPPAAAAASLAAVAAASIAGLALVLDRADVEGGVHRLDRLVRLRHRPVFADVQPDVASHEGHVAVVDQDRLILLDLTDLVVPEGEQDRRGLVPNRRLDELSRFAELRRDLSLFTQPDDLKFIHAWQNDEEIMRLARSFPDHTTSMVALEADYEKILKGEEPGRKEYIIEEGEGRTPLGWATLTIQCWPREGIGRSGEVGLALGERNRWRKGYGAEAVGLLLKVAFEQLNLHRVSWWTFAENAASLGLARKMGFKEECRVRDSVFFDNRYHDSVGLGLLRDEYQATSPDPVR